MVEAWMISSLVPVTGFEPARVLRPRVLARICVYHFRHTGLLFTLLCVVEYLIYYRMKIANLQYQDTAHQSLLASMV